VNAKCNRNKTSCHCISTGTFIFQTDVFFFVFSQNNFYFAETNFFARVGIIVGQDYCVCVHTRSFALKHVNWYHDNTTTVVVVALSYINTFVFVLTHQFYRFRARRLAVFSRSISILPLLEPYRKETEILAVFVDIVVDDLNLKRYRRRISIY